MSTTKTIYVMLKLTTLYFFYNKDECDVSFGLNDDDKKKDSSLSSTTIIYEPQPSTSNKPSTSKQTATKGKLKTHKIHFTSEYNPIIKMYIHCTHG